MLGQHITQACEFLQSYQINISGVRRGSAMIGRDLFTEHDWVISGLMRSLEPHDHKRCEIERRVLRTILCARGTYFRQRQPFS